MTKPRPSQHADEPTKARTRTDDVEPLVDDAVSEDTTAGDEGIDDISSADAGDEVTALDDDEPENAEHPDDEFNEAHSAEELERATVGRATRLTDGPGGTKHGEELLDSPDKAGSAR